jgi:hypothetical protein
MAYVTVEVPDSLSAHQVAKVIGDAACTLAQLNGMNCQRVAEQPTLVFRVFPLAQPKAPLPPKVVTLAERRKSAFSFRLSPDFPPSAA